MIEVSPGTASGPRQSPGNALPVAHRPRMNSNESENSAGSGKSQDSRSLTPFINLIPGSAPASRAGSFRERPPSAASSRRSPTVRAWGSVRARKNISISALPSNNAHSRTGHNGDPQTLGPRRSSMPNVAGNFLRVPEDQDNKLRRVRSFKTTSKGAVVNRGDSFKKKSTNSLMSTGSTVTEGRQQQQQANHQQYQHQPHVTNINSYLPGAPPIPTYYRVIIMGAAGCGKSLLTKQFMTSDFVGGNEDSQDHSERNVTVLLDGEESTIEFIDPANRNVVLEGLQQLLDAYVVVFAINEQATFEQARELVRYLRVETGTDRVIVLVANKIDLVRKRKVSADEAQTVAETYDCKYAETSAALNHFVDELLVGILTQIRLHMRIPFTTISFPGKEHKEKKKKKTLKGPRGFFARLFRRSSRKKMKPCEDLHTL